MVSSHWNPYLAHHISLLEVVRKHTIKYRSTILWTFCFPGHGRITAPASGNWFGTKPQDYPPSSQQQLWAPSWIPCQTVNGQTHRITPPITHDFQKHFYMLRIDEAWNRLPASVISQRDTAFLKMSMLLGICQRTPESTSVHFFHFCFVSCSFYYVSLRNCSAPGQHCP